MDKVKIEELLKTVEEQGTDSDKILDSIITEYTDSIDKTVKKIQSKMIEFNGDLPINFLINGITELQPVLFFTLAGLEKIGNRSDVAEQIRINKYNLARQGVAGTAADKTSHAETESQNEQFVSNIYTRSYKAIKNRCDCGQNLIDSLKKALSAKMSEMNLTRSQNISLQ
ncbi:MAG: hypothetical protein IKP71_09840 [Candidatus Riflebacteria bacterium]|nr:hypothetical protein [Candidatus Riflebacteria bacterium]